MIACRSQVPVVPVRIYGTFEALNRTMKKPRWGQKITVIYDKPMLPKDYDPGKTDKGRYLTAAQRIMDRITLLENPRSR